MFEDAYTVKIITYSEELSPPLTNVFSLLNRAVGVLVFPSKMYHQLSILSIKELMIDSDGMGGGLQPVTA